MRRRLQFCVSGERIESVSVPSAERQAERPARGIAGLASMMMVASPSCPAPMHSVKPEKQIHFTQHASLAGELATSGARTVHAADSARRIGTGRASLASAKAI